MKKVGFMTYDVLGAGALDYAPCSYGNSRLLFRGPKRRLDAPYVAFLGGTKTYGKFIKAPFPALVESDIGVNCVNFGLSNAGVDVFLNDVAVLDAAAGAKAVVFQIVGAQNLSNRFYKVHPRRNDRFLTASPMLKAVYPEVDFSDFHFTKHMLNHLHAVSSERFTVVFAELQKAWVARMTLIVQRLNRKPLLFWFAEQKPQDTAEAEENPLLPRHPLFVTRQMIEDLLPLTSGLIEVVATPEAMSAGTEGMVFSEMEAMAAREMFGPKAHGEAARKLGPALHGLVD